MGCGADDYGRLEPHPVSGQVVINGEPAEGCTVVLVPSDEELKNEVLPGGTTDAEGRFEITTHETGDGAPAGNYGVTIRWEATKWRGMEEELRIDPVQPVGPDRLQGRYSSPEKSGLTAVIKKGENRLEPFRLDDVKLLPGSS